MTEAYDMTYGELMQSRYVRQRAEHGRLIELWHVARWLVFWIVGSRMKRPKPLEYYLDIEKLVGSEAEKKTDDTPSQTIEERIAVYERLDRAAGRKSIDYRKMYKNKNNGKRRESDSKSGC